MLPEKHLDEKKLLDQRINRFRKLWLLGLFIFSALFAGPFIHETAHILWLDLNNCFHTSNLGFSFLSGLHGEVQSLCALNDTNLLIFYSLGYLSTLITASIMNISGTWLHRNEKKYAATLLSIGTGMFLSVIVSVSVTGDMVHAASVLGLPRIYAHAVSGLIILGVFAVVIESFEIVLEEFEEDQKGRNETETSP